MAKVRVTFTISEEANEMLERVSRRLGVSKSHLVDEMLLETLPILDGELSERRLLGCFLEKVGKTYLEIAEVVKKRNE